MQYVSENRIEYNSDAGADDTMMLSTHCASSLWFKFFTNTASFNSPNDPIS